MQGKIGLKQNKKYTVNFDEETAKKAYNQIMFLYEDSDEEEEDEVLNEQEGGFVEEEADEPADNAMAQADSYENKDSEDLIRMAHNNDIHAAYVLGKRYYNNGARDLAEEYLRFATNRGHRDACELLDKMWGGDSTIAVLGQDDLSEVD